jgi:hypothetical protein
LNAAVAASHVIRVLVRACGNIDAMSRVIVRIEIPRDGFIALQKAEGRFGMTQVSVISRMVEWFAAQTDEVQAAILHRLPNVNPTKVLLKTLSKG